MIPLIPHEDVAERSVIRFFSGFFTRRRTKLVTEGGSKDTCPAADYKRMRNIRDLAVGIDQCELKLAESVRFPDYCLGFECPQDHSATGSRAAHVPSGPVLEDVTSPYFHQPPSSGFLSLAASLPPFLPVSMPILTAYCCCFGGFIASKNVRPQCEH